ncbi:hypothetical protein FJZ31_09475 [Candidatus Poribacteria bacterium]|nr:hypothetical protein [Candidatus Poribacteria bacterium]
MNKPDYVMSKKDIETYILKKLKEIFWKFPRKISPGTTFREFGRNHDPYLIDPEFFIYIEEDLGVYLPDEEIEKLVQQRNVKVAALIDAIFRHVPEQALGASLISAREMDSREKRRFRQRR